MTPWERYQADLKRDDFAPDSAQEAAVRELQAVYDALIADPPEAGLWERLSARLRPRPKEPVRGLYFWGGVGRGKTYLVDTFFDCLPFAEKRRMHFHRFMQSVHHQLKRLQDQQDPLSIIGRDFARQSRVLCFDEFFVSDIADAMILGGLLKALFENGVTLIATSNIPPDKLYRDGLQRARFLPAIELIKRHTKTMNVDGGVDYRLRYLEKAEIFHVPLDEAGEQALAEDFGHLAEGPAEADTEVEVEGRRIPVRRMADGVVWFDFEALCDGPRGQADYIEIARTFHSVILSGVPVLDADHENQARRFISMVDEFYDHNVKLICTAEAEPAALYRGERLVFEFDRTISRLQEMRSHEYLGSEHKP